MILHLLTFVTAMTACDAYRILGVFPLNVKSHNIVFGALMKSLAKHGHHVDVISHYPRRIPMKNYYDIIDLSGTMESSVNSVTIEELLRNSADTSRNAEIFGNRLCHFMGFENMQKLIKNPPKDPPYDVVITEALFAHCYMGLGYVFKVPVVSISTGLEFPWITHFTGNNDNLAFVPNVLYTDTGHMNLYGRIKNVLINYIAIWEFHQATDKSQTESMRKYLSADIPNIREVEKNVALTLVNGHPILFGIKPLTPAVIQIGGIHIEANDETLPNELKNWLDESTAGVVYFTLGSMILIESLPPNKLRDVYASFKKISPVRVLMKIANCSKLLPGLPRNVKILSWIPQQPVLAHPNIKAFITHGGLGGLQEAVYYGVPMIALPLSGDQFRNVENLVIKKIMIRINFDEFSKRVLDSALEAVLHDPEYKKNAIYYSKLFRDQPITSTDKAIFHIEYVIRHGADVLRSPALKLSITQLTLIDVYGILLITVLPIFILLYLCMKISTSALVKWLLIQEVKKSKNTKKKLCNLQRHEQYDR